MMTISVGQTVKIESWSWLDEVAEVSKMQMLQDAKVPVWDLVIIISHPVNNRVNSCKMKSNREIQSRKRYWKVNRSGYFRLRRPAPFREPTNLHKLAQYKRSTVQQAERFRAIVSYLVYRHWYTLCNVKRTRAPFLFHRMH